MIKCLLTRRRRGGRAISSTVSDPATVGAWTGWRLQETLLQRRGRLVGVGVAGEWGGGRVVTTVMEGVCRGGARVVVGGAVCVVMAVPVVMVVMVMVAQSVQRGRGGVM